MYSCVGGALRIRVNLAIYTYDICNAYSYVWHLKAQKKAVGVCSLGARLFGRFERVCGVALLLIGVCVYIQCIFLCVAP